MSNPITLSQMKEVVEPILNENFDGIYDQRTNEWKGIFEEREGMKRSSHVETVLYGFNNAPIVGDGAPLPYDTGGTLWSINYPYYQVALGFAITEMAMEDGEHLDLAATFGKHLAQSMYETEEIFAANVLNQGFDASVTQKGGDGKPLFSTTHLMANGQTFSNVGTTAALSMTSLENILIQISLAVDPMGKRIKLDPKNLVIPPSLKFIAEVALKSILNPDVSASNQINPVNSMNAIAGGAKVVTRLTSNTAYFITTDLKAAKDKGLIRLNRRNLTGGSQEDFNTNSVQFKKSQRYIFSWCDPRSCYGNLGA